MIQRLFSVCWRLTILVLPWQTRWFGDASLVGWPWEQGRWSVYVSWLLIVATVILGLLVRRPGRFDLRKRRGPIVAVGLLLLVTVAACGTDVAVWKPALQWWTQVTLLALFVWTLVRAGIPRRTLAVWSVAAMMPHVVLGVWQYALQRVVGHPWLGIATQLPEDAGVSVIEHSVYRVLRMYGGFPHPNIFGGWAAVGYLLSLWLAATAATKSRALWWSAASASLAVALLLTYARGAWIASAVGTLVLVGTIVRAHVAKRPEPEGETTSLQYLVAAVAASILIAVAVAVPQADHLATRFHPSERLEAKSVEARLSSFSLGLDLVRRHPFIGIGPNADLLDMSRRLGTETSTEPLEPPHIGYLLAFADVGAVGLLALSYLGWLLVSAACRHKDFARVILSTLVILAVFDHYPWSLWAGQSLVALVVAIVLTEPPPSRREGGS